MGRLKGSGKKHTENAKEAVHGKKTEGVAPGMEVKPEAPALPAEQSPITPEVMAFDFDTVVWSEDNPPLLLKAGTPMPAGYKRERSEVKQHWVHDDRGVWSKGVRPA